LLGIILTVMFFWAALAAAPTSAQPTFRNGVLPNGVPSGASGTNIVESPPKFYDPASGDYRPDKPAGSPLIDLAGSDAPLGGRLLNGQTQTEGGWDAGALESNGVALSGELTRSLGVSQGWNMVGMPLKPGDEGLASLLPSACGPGYRWRPAEGSYRKFSSGETLAPGGGAWTFCESEGTGEVSGPAASDKTVEVEGGWNQVGPFEAEIGPGEVGQEPSGLLETGTWFRWDPAQGQYTEPQALEPGEGYWVFATEDGTLDFSGGGSTQATAAAGSARSKGTASAQEKPEGTLTLQVTDQAGHSREVYLARELTEKERGRWRLPPVGPGNVFAARFAGGFQAAEAGGSSLGASARKGAVLRVRGAEGPVTLRLQAPEGQSSGKQSSRKETGGRSVRVTGAGTGAPGTGGERFEARLTRESPSAQVPEGAERLRLSVESVPAEAALRAPYPNPASGEVTLRYALPERRAVTINVYDVLGRKVATLASGKREAGTHRADLEASRLPSGTYFIRMQAGSFQKTRRVAVVR
jgi:hypothetical protein